MFSVMSCDNCELEVSVICDNLAESQSPNNIVEFFQGNQDFEDAETIAIYALDETQGVRLIQKVFIYPRIPEQEQAEQEAAKLMEQLKALLPKRRLLCTSTQADLIDLTERYNSELQDA